MKELSLHILDIVNNSTVAGASLVEITVDENTVDNRLTITIRDNGKGMDEDFLAKVRDPFTTSRTTRKVGMGIPLFENAAMSTGGGFDIYSKIGEGTSVIAWFVYDHIDRQPIGDVPSTLITLIRGTPNVDFSYSHSVDGEVFKLDTREIKKILGDVPIDSYEVAQWIKEYVIEGINSLRR